MKKKIATLILLPLLVGGIAFAAGALLFPNRSHRTVRLREVAKYDSLLSSLGYHDTAVVTILEVSDFTCTYCRKVQKALETTSDRYGDSVKIVFAPLPRGDRPDRHLLASAYIAAVRQNKGAEMKRLLFREALGLPRTKPESDPEFRKKAAEEMTLDAAQKIGLDTAQFVRDLHSEEIERILDGIKAEAERLNISSTPTFIVNGYMARGALSFEGFEQVVSAVLKNNEKRKGSGV